MAHEPWLVPSGINPGTSATTGCSNEMGSVLASTSDHFMDAAGDDLVAFFDTKCPWTTADGGVNFENGHPANLSKAFDRSLTANLDRLVHREIDFASPPISGG